VCARTRVCVCVCTRVCCACACARACARACELHHIGGHVAVTGLRACGRREIESARARAGEKERKRDYPAA
jgi:hypothetical protein